MAEALPGTSAQASLNEPADPQLIVINFSRTADRLITGGDYGFEVYKTRPTDMTPRLLFEMSRQPTQKDYTTFVNDVVLVESLPPLHKFALVFGKVPHTLHFYDALVKRFTGLNYFAQKILSVKACTSIIAVGLEKEIHCFRIQPNNYEDLKNYIRLIIHPAPPNFSLLMDLTGEEKPRLVYPDSETEGLVAVQNICFLSHSKNLINAHNHPIGALRLNDQATLLATTSNVSTVIRVYDARTTECLVVFRRGISRSVMVHSMAFSTDSRFLCFTSNTETVHVFRIEGPIPKELRLEEEIALQFEMRERMALNPPGWHDYVEETKRAIIDYIAPTRDFASAILPETATLNVASLKDVNTKLYIMVAISSRKYFIFLINRDGGSAKLIESDKLESKVTLPILEEEPTSRLYK